MLPDRVVGPVPAPAAANDVSERAEPAKTARRTLPACAWLLQGVRHFPYSYMQDALLTRNAGLRACGAPWWLGTAASTTATTQRTARSRQVRVGPRLPEWIRRGRCWPAAGGDQRGAGGAAALAEGNAERVRWLP